MLGGAVAAAVVHGDDLEALGEARQLHQRLLDQGLDVLGLVVGGKEVAQGFDARTRRGAGGGRGVRHAPNPSRRRPHALVRSCRSTRYSSAGTPGHRLQLVAPAAAACRSRSRRMT